MLTALAPSGPVAQSVPTSPPSTTDSTQSGRRESFQNVYRSVPTDDESQSDAAPQPKTGAPTVTKSKKTGATDGNDKTDVTALPMPRQIVLQKVPLTFAFPSLGPEVEPRPAADESASGTEDGPDSSTHSPNTSAKPAGVPDFVVSLAKPGQTDATPLIAPNEKLAFSARLTQSDPPPSAPQPAPEPATRTSTPSQPSRSQSGDNPRASSDSASAASGKDPYQAADVKKADAPETVTPVREISSTSALDLRQTASSPQLAESAPAPPARSLAIQDVQPAVPEIPKPPASTEILLQVGGQDQSTASVRVVDRLGTINVTVHATDPDLRSSLRSNLSDLASQLTGQGYKTEMIKPAVLAANADNQHDSRQSGRDASGQQQHHQFTPEGRQNQRDRRANSDRWRDEFQQETSGTAGAPGGNS